MCQLEVNMYTKSNAKHKCWVRYCNTCKTTIPVNDFTHQCLIKNIRLRAKKHGSVRLYMDIEIKAYTDKKCNERFVACLLVAKSACDNCPPTNEVPCVTCKSINKTFLGVSCVQEFIDFVLKLELDYGNSVSVINVLSLNGGKFDNWLLFEYILKSTDYISKPPLLRSNKIILLRDNKQDSFIGLFKFCSNRVEALLGCIQARY